MLIFSIAIFTGCGIVFFQLYWLAEAFDTTHVNFYKTASNSLQKTIDHYRLKQTSSILHFKPGDTTLSIGLPADEKVINKEAGTAYGNRGGTSGVYHQFEPELTSSNIDAVKIMMARMIAQVTSKPIDLQVLEKNYHEELLKDKIDIPFRLSMIPANSKLSRFEVVAYAGLSKKSEIIRASFELTTFSLIRYNIIQMLISAGLILLTSGCLFYMWHVIRQQATVDNLKNDLINNLTHEFRTPITILKSTHEAIEKYGDSSGFANILRYIKANQSVLNMLESNVDRILDITRYESRSEQVVLTVFSLRKLVGDIITSFELGTDITIEYAYKRNVETVYSDGFIIATIVSNLVDNAMKYGGGKVKVGVSAGPFNNRWILEVSDNGSGIPQECINLIFDKFYRIPTGNVHDVKGYGIGLSYVKILSGLLNGHLTVVSTVGEGSIFKIEFPLNE